jgi:hypothetical protein
MMLGVCLLPRQAVCSSVCGACVSCACRRLQGVEYGVEDDFTVRNVRFDSPLSSSVVVAEESCSLGDQWVKAEYICLCSGR